MEPDEIAELRKLVKKYGPMAVARACWTASKPARISRRYPDNTLLVDIPLPSKSKAGQFIRHHFRYFGIVTAGDLYAIPPEEWGRSWDNLGKKGADELARIMFNHEGEE